MIKSIVFFIGPFGSGGGERNCCNLANAFVDRGIAVTVVAIGVKNHLYLKRFDPRVRFVSLEKHHLRHAIIPMYRFLKAEQPGHVLAFNHYMGTGLELLRKLPGINFRLYMRNIVGLTQKYQMNKSFWQSTVSKAFVRLLLKDIDGIISQCFAMEKDLVANWGIRPEQSKVIYNPVSAEIEAQMSQPAQKKSNEILFVGRLSPEKNVDLLMRSFKELLPKYPDLKLRILGEGNLEPSLRTLAAELGITDKVIFGGFVADPISYYREAKVTALPSSSEGFPNVLIESISLGTPVVAFDCETGPAEIILQNKNGILVELGNQKEFTRALDRCLSSSWNFDVNRYRPGPIITDYISFLSGESGIQP